MSFAVSDNAFLLSTATCLPTRLFTSDDFPVDIFPAMTISTESFPLAKYCLILSRALTSAILWVDSSVAAKGI